MCNLNTGTKRSQAESKDYEDRQRGEAVLLDKREKCTPPRQYEASNCREAGSTTVATSITAKDSGRMRDTDFPTWRPRLGFRCHSPCK